MGKSKNNRKAKAKSRPHRVEMRHLHSKGVMLTPLKKRDLQTLLRLEQDPLVAKRFGWKDGQPSKKDCLDQIKASKEQFKRGKPVLLGVRKKPDGKLLGVIQMRWGSDQRAELAWMFLPKYQDGKLFFRAQRIAINWCLDRGAKRVWAASYA